MTKITQREGSLTFVHIAHTPPRVNLTFVTEEGSPATVDLDRYTMFSMCEWLDHGAVLTDNFRENRRRLVRYVVVLTLFAFLMGLLIGVWV